MSDRKVTVLRTPDGRFAGSLRHAPTPAGAPTPPPTPLTTKAIDNEPSALAATIDAFYRVPDGHVRLVDVNGTSRIFPDGDLENATWHLMNGNCHSFAAAIHEATGYPIIVFWAADSDYDEDSHLTHVAVSPAPGLMLDALGVSSIESFEHTELVEGQVLDGGVGELATVLEWDSAENQRIWQPLDPEMVHSFVAPVQALLDRFRSNPSA